MLKLAKECGGDVREFSSNAMVVIAGFNALHDAYLAGVTSNPGKLPVVALKSTKDIKRGQSTNFQPVFEITGWAPRPADLVFKPKAVDSKHIDAPAPASVTPETIAAAMNDAEDFG